MMKFFSGMIILPLLGIFAGTWSFVSNRKHLLNMLISLEFIVLHVYWLMASILGTYGSMQFFVLFFLTLGVCEGALGLSLLVSTVRSYGNDNFSSFSVLSC